MSRITNVNHFFSGTEPRFKVELSKTELMTTLSWYSQNKTTKDSQKYAHDFFKKKFKVDISSVIGKEPSTFGFLCRIVSNGGILPQENQTWFTDKIEELKTLVKETKASKNVKLDAEPKNVISIQERLAEKIAEIAGELEGSIDDYMLSDFERMPSPYGIMHGKAKAMHANRLIEIFKKRRMQFDDALNTKDAQVKEGYSNFTRPQLKKMIAYCDQIITDCLKINGESIKTRKPRKRKVKSPDELVAKMVYCKEFAELKLTSVQSKDIIGAMQLWVYNTKTRKLGCYHAEDIGGLSVKGSTLLNYNKTKSVMKTLRKPEQILPEVLKGGKVFLRSVIDNIKAVESTMSGRINGDTILLKVVK